MFPWASEPHQKPLTCHVRKVLLMKPRDHALIRLPDQLTYTHLHRLLIHFASLLITFADFPHPVLGLENGTLNVFLKSLYQHTLLLHTHPEQRW